MPSLNTMELNAFDDADWYVTPIVPIAADAPPLPSDLEITKGVNSSFTSSSSSGSSPPSPKSPPIIPLQEFDKEICKSKAKDQICASTPMTITVPSGAEENRAYRRYFVDLPPPLSESENLIFKPISKDPVDGDENEGLGEGLIGKVIRLDEKRALKIPWPDEQSRGALRREAAILRHLHHPNIIRTFPMDEIRDGLVMELGCHLPKDISSVDMTEMAGQLFRTLHYLHTHKHLVHGDLKPANLLLQDSSGVHLLLIDFGQARYIEVEGGRAIQHEGEDEFAAGTTKYLAPELLILDPTQRSQADMRAAEIYSAGVTLFELATGEDAFPGLYGAKLILTIRNGGFLRRLDQSPQSWDANIKRVVRMCAQVNPKERPKAHEALKILGEK